MAKTRRRDGISLAKGPAGILGLAMIVLGVASYLSGADSFSADPFRGTVNGDTFLGLEANGWTSVLWAGSGALLLGAAPMHWGAKTMALTVAFVLGACALLWVADGSDALGIFAANAGTATAWAIAAGILLLVALLPRVGKRRRDAAHEERAAVLERERASEREAAVRRERAEQPTVAHEAVRNERVEREPERAGGRRFARDEDRVPERPVAHEDGTATGSSSAARREV